MLKEKKCLEWQRQLSHLKELNALFKVGEKLAVCDAGRGLCSIYTLHILRYPDFVLCGHVGVCVGNQFHVVIHSWAVWKALYGFC